jgi:hypothetical protein
MQIHNTVELFFAADVLIKNNFSALMIEINPTLLKGNEIFFIRDIFVLFFRKKDHRE